MRVPSPLPDRRLVTLHSLLSLSAWLAPTVPPAYAGLEPKPQPGPLTVPPAYAAIEPKPQPGSEQKPQPVPMAAAQQLQLQTPAEPSAEAVAVAKRAFQAFDRRQLPLAEQLFTQTIDEWRRLGRGVEELTALLVARAAVRTDLSRFALAVEDLDEAIALMSSTGSTPAGIARYREYPDAFVQRGLAKEGLREWQAAADDYTRAVTLWGGVGDGVNPFALTYRGRARAELGEYEAALGDFRAASSVFSRVDKNDNQAAAARAQEVITLFALGRRDEGRRIARQVVTRTPGFTDLHVLLAADAWDRGDRDLAFSEWEFACEAISTGCRKYKDMQWLAEVRRWPAPLVEMQSRFLQRTPPNLP